MHTEENIDTVYYLASSHKLSGITPGPVFMLKIVFGMVNVSFNDFFSFGTLLKTRGHAYKLYKPQTTKTARKNFFAERVINVWNSLPPL